MKLTPAEERIVAAFRNRLTREYARRKLQSDPIYAAVTAVVSVRRGPLLDLGCGIGLLVLYLRAHGIQQQVTAVDRDSRKIAQAHDAIQQLNVKGVVLLEQDVREPLEFAGNVLMLDVLHYFSPDDQEKLLLHAAKQASESGAVVIIRECLRDSSWRFRATVVQEKFSRAIRWLRSEQMHFPRRDTIVATMESAGMTPVDVRPLWGRTPFNNYLLVFERRQEA